MNKHNIFSKKGLSKARKQEIANDKKRKEVEAKGHPILWKPFKRLDLEEKDKKIVNENEHKENKNQKQEENIHHPETMGRAGKHTIRTSSPSTSNIMTTSADNLFANKKLTHNIEPSEMPHDQQLTNNERRHIYHQLPHYIPAPPPLYSSSNNKNTHNFPSSQFTQSAPQTSHSQPSPKTQKINSPPQGRSRKLYPRFPQKQQQQRPHPFPNTNPIPPQQMETNNPNRDVIWGNQQQHKEKERRNLHFLHQINNPQIRPSQNVINHGINPSRRRIGGGDENGNVEKRGQKNDHKTQNNQSINHLLVPWPEIQEKRDQEAQKEFALKQKNHKQIANEISSPQNFDPSSIINHTHEKNAQKQLTKIGQNQPNYVHQIVNNHSRQVHPILTRQQEQHLGRKSVREIGQRHPYKKVENINEIDKSDWVEEYFYPEPENDQLPFAIKSSQSGNILNNVVQDDHHHGPHGHQPPRQHYSSTIQNLSFPSPPISFPYDQNSRISHPLSPPLNHIPLERSNVPHFSSPERSSPPTGHFYDRKNTAPLLPPPPLFSPDKILPSHSFSTSLHHQSASTSAHHLGLRERSYTQPLLSNNSQNPMSRSISENVFSSSDRFELVGQSNTMNEQLYPPMPHIYENEPQNDHYNINIKAEKQILDSMQSTFTKSTLIDQNRMGNSLYAPKKDRWQNCHELYSEIEQHNTQAEEEKEKMKFTGDRTNTPWAYFKYQNVM